jgi:glycosyltransferase involved in cell wall biosynthesis
MRVLIITDSLFAAREWEMFSRLEIGLASEGISVVHAIPADAVSHVMSAGDNPVFSAIIPFVHSSVPFTLGLRTQRLLSAVRDRLAVEADEPAFDLVHAFGGRAIPLALAAAEREEVPVVIEAWRTGSAARLSSMIRPGGPVVYFSAPDAAIQREIYALGNAAQGSSSGAAAVQERVRVVPWGVHMPEWVRAKPFAHHTLSAMVIGSGHDAQGMAAALEGLSRACPPDRELLIFVDADAGRRARVWRIANRLGIAGAVSFVDNLEARRDLLVAGDLLVSPEARGEHRTALLEAFACEMLVVAAADPGVSCLRDGQTARLVNRPDPALWEEAVRSLIESSESSKRLAASAKSYVEMNHLASTQVRLLIDLYTEAVGGGVLKLDAANR